MPTVGHGHGNRYIARQAQLLSYLGGCHGDMRCHDNQAKLVAQEAPRARILTPGPPTPAKLARAWLEQLAARALSVDSE